MMARASRCWLLAALAVASTGLALPAAASGLVLSPQAKVEERSQADYAMAWWQWAMRLPDGVRPYQDPSGAQCALAQTGPVWFLAGTDGTMRVQRRCVVPKGKYVFLPAIALLAHAKPGKPITCQQARDQVARTNDHLAQVQVSLDGEAITNIAAHRLGHVPCFDAFKNAAYLERHAPYMPAATDGYWLMLAPLPAGLHRLSVKVRYGSPGTLQGDLEEDFEYQLWIGEVPNAATLSVDSIAT